MSDLSKLIFNFLFHSNLKINPDKDISRNDILLKILSLLNQNFSNIDTIIYCGNNPFTFIVLFITSYFGKKHLIKIDDIENMLFKTLKKYPKSNIVIDNILLTENINAYLHKLFSTLFPVTVFTAHDIDINPYLVYTKDKTFKTIKDLKSISPVDARVTIESVMYNLNNNKENLLSVYSSGIHSQRKLFSFNEKNILAILKNIDVLAELKDSSAIKILSSVDNSWAFMLYCMFNNIPVRFKLTDAITSLDQMYSDTVILTGQNLKMLWDLYIKENIYSKWGYILDSMWITKWLVKLELKSLLKDILGKKVKTIYVINAKLPKEIKVRLRRIKNINVVFLYGNKETGNIIASNYKKDKLSHNEYLLHKMPGNDTTIISEHLTKVIHIQGNNIAHNIKSHYVADSIKDEDTYVSTEDLGTIKENSIIQFISPQGIAVNKKRTKINPDLYFIEESLSIIPYVKQAMTFDHKEKFYVAVILDERYSAIFNMDLVTMEKQLDRLREELNLSIENKSHKIQKIGITSSKMQMNIDDEPIRFIHKIEKI